MTVGDKNNYSSYKIRSDFFYLWRLIFEVFSSLLKAEEDYKTYKQTAWKLKFRGRFRTFYI